MDEKRSVFWPARTRSIVFTKTTMLREIMLNDWKQMNFIVRHYVCIIMPNLKSLHIYLLYFISNKNIRECTRNNVPSTIGTVNYLVFESFGRPCGKAFDTFVLYQPNSHSCPLLLSYRIEVNDVNGIWLEVVPLFMRICWKFIEWINILAPELFF
jgi:hypothetical protein